MKIFYVHIDPLPSPMAGSVFSLFSTLGMAKAGHKVHLVAPWEKSEAEIYRYYGIGGHDNLHLIPAKPQIARLGPFSFAWSKGFFQDVERILRTEAIDADAIIVRPLKLAHYLTNQAPFAPPIIYEAHDWYADIEQKWRDAQDLISKKKYRRELKLQQIEHETLPRLSGVICLRSATQKLFNKHYPDTPSAVCPTGLEPPDALAPVADEPIAAYLGQLHPHKGLDILFKAAAYCDRFKLLIIGGGDWLAHWQNVACYHGIENRVEFVGHVPKAEAPHQLSKARVGVLPLLDCFYNRHLTSPVKIMDYFAAGLPVVTVDAPTTGELVRHEQNGLLIPFDDAQALADAIERLCEDKELYEQCRETIQQDLPRMTWRQRGMQVAQFVKQLNQKRRAIVADDDSQMQVDDAGDSLDENGDARERNDDRDPKNNYSQKPSDV